MRIAFTLRRSTCTAIALTVWSGLLSATLHAQSSNPWVLVDDFQYLGSAYPWGITQDPIGNMYVVGWGVSNGVQRALTRLSRDGGTTWTLVDDFAYLGGSINRFFKVSADGSGNVFVAGQTHDSAGHFHWLVRRSQDSGVTWVTVDDYMGPGNGAGGGAWTTGVLAQNAGGVYVIGQGSTTVSAPGNKSNYANDWIVRRSLDGGSTWATVDDYEFAPGVSGGVSQAQSITLSSAGLFVVGFARNGGWIVRRSPTGDAGSWSTVDVYNPSAALSVFPYTAGTDANGYVYTAGFGQFGTKGCNYNHWMVRRSTDNGTTWAVTDNLGPDAGTPCSGGSIAHGFALDALNNIVMVGVDNDASGSFWLSRNSEATSTSSTGDPGTWVTTDAYQYGSTNNTSGVDICRDSAGDLFAAGVSGSHWLVRKQVP